VRRSVSNNLVDPDLSAAVTTYIWPGTTSFPMASTGAVVDGFGSDAAVEPVPLIKSLQEELWQFEWFHGESITDAAARVGAGLAVAHPELSTEAVDALVNSWAFNISRQGVGCADPARFHGADSRPGRVALCGPAVERLGNRRATPPATR
jgi:hypothetical protein